MIIESLHVQLLAISRLYPNWKFRHVPCNLSSWKTLTEWTHNLSHTNLQFKTKHPMLFLKQCALKTYAGVEV